MEVADKGLLAETLCVHEERTVARDNTITLGKLTLQLPSSPDRPHYVRARVRVHIYPDRTMAIFRGPKRIGCYDKEGKPAQEKMRRAAA